MKGAHILWHRRSTTTEAVDRMFDDGVAVLDDGICRWFAVVHSMASTLPADNGWQGAAAVALTAQWPSSQGDNKH